MQLNPRTARPMTTAIAGLSAHGTPDPDTNEDEIPLEEQTQQQGGLREEVGDLEEDDDQALPGRVGGGLAGG
ncbi:hypothetical protein XarbCFBP8130_13795 [Xanthomonas arboricola]|uniref:hypothetical protein n=1 Tax=Xanthomonas arboricola TaxID=56448 RepID=UPI0007EC7E26|nr:hypothetical protein [Xanthomonas arboricola]MBB4708376.1 hypothetical protein [Xanthomonas arboricola]NJC03251.1 hypothetical protein [Xanthomonas arboricola]OBR78372.1 hypothetical protein A7D01_20060 [Xanthomonas arboricola]PPT56794.1 hypothetical protein XarbCFBP8153_17440 [Xanthomonas arboricola]PPT62950.1 hypothetical protein XarbCFBP8130_13795 [Xanthomonas arboricola]